MKPETKLLADLSTCERTGRQAKKAPPDVLLKTVAKMPEAGKGIAQAWALQTSGDHMTALSRKSYRHISKTLATQSGMTNQWLKKQGLISIKDLWVFLHYPDNLR